MLPFAAAAFAPMLISAIGHRGAWLLALVPAVAFAYFAVQVDQIAAGAAVTGGFDWVPSLGVRLSWRLDGLSLTFALLISGIGFLIILYSGAYLRGQPGQGRFLAFMLLFMGSMQGLVSADSLVMLFVFWELTSITSFLLIGFDHARGAARRAALQALVVTGAGGLALLAGALAMRSVTGADGLTGLLASGEALRSSPLYPLVLMLIMAAAFTKSAQFPFHFWLPNAMQAPTPVSAYLHSATMVKAGVYLLMRLNPVLGGTNAWETVLPLVGGATLLAGAILALRQTDLKLMLAQTTVASLGLMVMLVGIGTEAAIVAAVLYLIAHALFKGALFMVAGVIDHETGARDIRALGGLGRAMPITFAAGLLAALSMGGVPLLFGFLAKEEIYAALTTGEGLATAALVAAILANAAMFAIGFYTGVRPFAGERRAGLERVHEASPLLWLGPLVLAVAGLAAGLASASIHAWLSGPMASAISGRPVSVGASAVPHLGLPLALSVATILLGILASRGLTTLRRGADATLEAIGWGPDRGFDQAVRGLLRLAVTVTRVIQNGRLDIYMTVTFVTVAAALLAPMVLAGELPDRPPWPDLRFYEWTILLIAALGLAAIVIAKDRLTAIVCLGIQGFAAAVIFMLFGAPDLSFTQFMIETLSVVILALVMTRLRLSPSDRRPLGQKALDTTVSAACGIGFALLLLKVTQSPFDDTLTRFFNANSLAVAHGRNVVNVIIVDFRGLDTLGEISVVMAAGLAILALIRVRTTASGQARRA